MRLGLDQKSIGISFSLKSCLYSQENPVGITIDLVSKDCSVLERLPDPFVSEESAPLYRVLRGRFVIGNKAWRQILLVLDQDERPTNCALTNPEIELLWQETWQSVKDRSEVLGLADEADNVVLCSPLIFCKKERRYFSPLCPSCGQPLDLCTHEEKLLSKGLASFLRSHRRYLYCSRCEEEVFYVRVKGPEERKNGAVKDFAELVSAWSALLEQRHLASVFPCVECAEQKLCFQVRGLATDRLVPLSFYPFHLLIFEAYPLKAREFLRFLDSPEEMGGRTFFFGSEDPRRGFENLYLKLSFLGTVVERYLASSRLPLKLEDIRVKPGVYEHLFFPSAWAFDLTRVGLIRGPEDYPLPRPQNLAWFTLALIWFETISGMERSLMAKVLSDLLAHEIVDQEQFRTLLSSYLPELSSSDPLVKYRCEALYMGWQILLASYQSGEGHKVEEVLEPLRALLTRLQKEMWDVPQPSSAKKKEISEEDQALAKILREIKESLEKELSSTQPTAERVEVKSTFMKKGFDEEETLPFGTSRESLGEEAIPETVILKPGEGPKISSDSPLRAEKKVEKGLEEKIFLEETVILKGAPPDDKGK